MNDSAKLRRQLHLIRCLDKPYSYPSLTKLSDYLRDKDINQTSTATVERDLSDIRADYDITVTYNRREGGYFLDFADDDEDMGNFRHFVRLLERRERLAVLTQSGRTATQHIQLEQHDNFRGLDLMSPLWNALQRRVVVTFQYQAYKDLTGRSGVPVDAPSEQCRANPRGANPRGANPRGANPRGANPRRVEPGLLFEYRNRWYLDGYDLDRHGARTFGLDRMVDLELSPQPIDPKRQIDYRAARSHVIGVTAPPTSPVERVILRFYRPQAEYILSLPMHHSQQTLHETPTHVDILLQVVLNPELEREIMAYGEAVEVLEPVILRERIVDRVGALQKRYVLPEGHATL